MSSGEDQATDENTRRQSHPLGYTRPLTLFALFIIALTQVPVVSAHGATETSTLSQEHGVLLGFVGVVLVVGAVLFKRMERVSPTVALYGVFVGIVVTALGAVLFEGLSPDPTYTADSMPFPRSWYQPLGLLTGAGIAMASFIIGWLRWPTRPRYTFLGILLGMWISYPYLIPGTASSTHPLGYGIVLGTPILVGYIVWKDAGSALQTIFRDPVARRFGIGVGIVLTLFFFSVTGYLSFFPEEGYPHNVVITVLPVSYQLVTWPTLEIFIPHIPVFLAISPGQLGIVGMLSALIGLNAALIAYRWRAEERAGLTEGTAGSAAIVGTCTCGCCGPLVAKFAVLAAAPSIAAPLYWVFVDNASPLSALFIVGSVLLFAGSLIHAINSAHQPANPRSFVSAD